MNKVAADAFAAPPCSRRQQISMPGGPLLEIVKVNQPDAHLNFAVTFGGQDIRALQLVWADGHGRWPWAATFCDGRRRQPVLGIRAQNA